jgi:hypothetical protein
MAVAPRIALTAALAAICTDRGMTSDFSQANRVLDCTLWRRSIRERAYAWKSLLRMQV